jgi:hypothetical protein
MQTVCGTFAHWFTTLARSAPGDLLDVKDPLHDSRGQANDEAAHQVRRREQRQVTLLCSVCARSLT